MYKKIIPLFFLILSHLFPLYGLLYLGWSPYQTILCFNIETLIIIFFSEIKILTRLITGGISEIVAVIITSFFLIYTGLFFNLINFVLSTLMFGTTEYSITWQEVKNVFVINFFAIIPSIVFMVIRHFFDFVDFIQRKEYEKKITKDGPHGIRNIAIRIFMQQFTIIFGGIFGKVSGHLNWGVGFIVILQFIYSLVLFRKSL